MSFSTSSRVLGFVAAFLLLADGIGAQLSHYKISDTHGGFSASWSQGLGLALESVGDLDGDGVEDLAASSVSGDVTIPGGYACIDTIWILFRNSDGSVKSWTEIGSNKGGFVGTVDCGFGGDISSLGDLDGDGNVELAVGNAAAPYDDLSGAVWILFLNDNGTVKAQQEIGNGIGGLSASIDRFGESVGGLGDVDGDGVNDLAVGAGRTIPTISGGPHQVWILFLNANGSVKSEVQVSGVPAAFNSGFGWAVDGIGDIDQNGVPDLAVGAPRDGTYSYLGAGDYGALWTVLLNADGSVLGSQFLSGFAGDIFADDEPFLGASVAGLGDLDGDGVGDVAVGGYRDDAGGSSSGAVWVLYLNADGTSKLEVKIGANLNGFGDVFHPDDRFGVSVAALEDGNGDNIAGLAVGSPGADDGGPGRGVIWVIGEGNGLGHPIELPPGNVLSHSKLSELTGDFGGGSILQRGIGAGIANIGDLNGDGVIDLAVGATCTSCTSGPDPALWILFMNSDGSVASEQRIAESDGGFTGSVDVAHLFGASVAAIGDLDGNGVTELVVGAARDDDGALPGEVYLGAVWILFMEADGTVSAQQKISETQGGFSGDLISFGSFGTAVAGLGDLDLDGNVDIAVGAPGSLGPIEGAVWVLFLNADGTVKSHQRISYQDGNFFPSLNGPFWDNRFGTSIASLGDFDNDGIMDLAVGATWDDDDVTGNFFNVGAVYLLYLNTDGTVKGHHKISEESGGGPFGLPGDGHFGQALAALGDVDADGFRDLAVGSTRNDVRILFLDGNGSALGSQLIEQGSGNFQTTLGLYESFGESLAPLGDLDGDGKVDLIVGASRDNDGGSGHGAIWPLFLESDDAPFVRSYGCGLNPPGSLAIVGSLATIGSSITIAMDNPLGTQGTPSFPIYFFGLSSLEGIPCGIPIPGYGMNGPGAAGSSLIGDLLNLIRFGPPWQGAGQPSTINLNIVNEPSLIGVRIYTQGLMFDPVATFGVEFGLTEALELKIGP